MRGAGRVLERQESMRGVQSENFFGDETISLTSSHICRSPPENRAEKISSSSDSIPFVVLDSFSDKQRIELYGHRIHSLNSPPRWSCNPPADARSSNRPGRSTGRIVDLIRPKSVPDLNQKAIPIPKPTRRGIQRQQHLRSPLIRRGLPAEHAAEPRHQRAPHCTHSGPHHSATAAGFMPPVQWGRENSSRNPAAFSQADHRRAT